MEHGDLHAERLEGTLLPDRPNAHDVDWKEFWERDDWEYWESREDSACQNCAMHSGFEASAVREARKNPRDMVRLAAWNFSG